MTGWEAGTHNRPTASSWGIPKSRLGKILETMQSLQQPSTVRETADSWDAGGLQRSQWVLAFSSSLIAALPELEYITVYYPEGTAEFLLQQQYFFVMPMP